MCHSDKANVLVITGVFCCSHRGSVVSEGSFRIHGNVTHFFINRVEMIKFNFNFFLFHIFNFRQQQPDSNHL